MIREPLEYPGDPYNDPDYDEIAILKAEIERLKAENARLTQALEQYSLWKARAALESKP